MKNDKIFAVSVAIIFLCTLALSFMLGNTTSNDADFVYLNGKVLKANPEQYWVEEVAIKDDRIIYAGSDTEIRSFIGEKTNVIDIEGKVLLPGIAQEHNHPLNLMGLVTDIQIDFKEESTANFSTIAKHHKDEILIMEMAKMNTKDIIRAFTTSPNYITNWEEMVGSLETGSPANLILVDTNIFEVSNEEISNTKVLSSMMNGRIISEQTNQILAISTSE